ncbi:oligopeptide transporter 1-like isoform X4 [Macadamia integrifolia]|uniref:oligopeptide transporter 1-like isoform X4 n=1 Tax=Macadamia integrifolia TaxID=60698 RepID=UPI001C4E8823|nr:oligopeptide transporter 1-like isoform X4 [Macadamia integrifolia]
MIKVHASPSHSLFVFSPPLPCHFFMGFVVVVAEDVNDCPIEEVRLTVPITDDRTMPALTFRTWVLGVLSCSILSFVNQFFRFRQNPVSIGSISVQLVILPVGKLMAATLPEKILTVPMTGWSFSLNPGPFNMKEHVLITIFANVGSGGVYALHIVTILKVFYKKEIQPILAVLLILITQSPSYIGPMPLKRSGFRSSQAAHLMNLETATMSHGSWIRKLLLSINKPMIATMILALTLHRSIWRQMKSSIQDNSGDVHNRIMKNYNSVPQWWFYTVFVVVLPLAIFTCEGFGGKLQLPYWGVLLAIALGIVFTLPIGVITATTNQQPGLNVITELIVGYLYPGRPIANVAFKTYGYVSVVQSIFFLQDLKLGHYMKIPPRSMFLVQMVGTLINNMITFGTAWWLLTTVDNICDVTQLPKGSPWTCPGDNVFYSASIIWGVVGPLRMFGKLGVYAKLNWFFLVGLISPVPIWWLSRKFPQHRWIELIHMPLIFYNAGSFPEVKAVNYWSWGIVGIFFNVYVYRWYRGWWARHNYVLSAALDAGVAFLALLVYFSLQMNGISGPDWWGAEEGDHCPLATCPTDPRIMVDGCPAVS